MAKYYFPQLFFLISLSEWSRALSERKARGLNTKVLNMQISIKNSSSSKKEPEKTHLSANTIIIKKCFKLYNFHENI